MAVTSKRTKRKARQRPPWGKLADGKPIEDFGRTYHRVKIDSENEEDHTKKEQRVQNDFSQMVFNRQYQRMLEIKKHYGIVGENGWRPWYDLALAIASELDDSLKLIDPIPRRTDKTAPRWKGAEGKMLLDEVKMYLESRPKRSVRWCLAQFQKMAPRRYGGMSLNQFVVRYAEAKKHHTTK